MTNFKQDETHLYGRKWVELCDIVHDLKSQEASAINNAGKEAQIAYITGLTTDDVEYVIHRLRLMVYELGGPAERRRSDDLLDSFGLLSDTVTKAQAEALRDHLEMMGR